MRVKFLPVPAGFALATLVLVLGCGGAPEQGTGPVTQPPAARPEPAAEPAAAAGSATVTGIVTFRGEVPKLRVISMSADPACASQHTEPPRSELLVLGEGDTLANVFVKVASGLPDREWPTPSEPAVLNQKGCRYDPHVLGVMVRQPLKVLNSDGLLHNVHALPKTNKSFNMAMPASRTEAVETFNQVEDMFTIKCDVHPWMNAYVGVLSHPYFSVTGNDGAFTISGLPSGTYEIEAWHEKLGTRTATVTVADGATESVSFTFTR